MDFLKTLSPSTSMSQSPARSSPLAAAGPSSEIRLMKATLSDPWNEFAQKNIECKKHYRKSEKVNLKCYRNEVVRITWKKRMPTPNSFGSWDSRNPSRHCGFVDQNEHTGFPLATFPVNSTRLSSSTTCKKTPNLKLMQTQKKLFYVCPGNVLARIKVFDFENAIRVDLGLFRHCRVERSRKISRRPLPEDLAI